MLIVRDENKLRAPSVCRRGRFSFILTALNSSVCQDSSWSDMSALSGKTTRTNGFDGREIFQLFRSCNNNSNPAGQITEIRGFLCPFGKHANMSRPFKIERSIELLVTHFFQSFHRLGYTKRKKANLVTVYD